MPTIFNTIKYYIDDNECWICTSHKFDPMRYYTATILYKKDKIHRRMWSIFNNQEIPEGMVIRHLCNNGRCINPSHLAIGTHNDNVQDRVRSNRSAVGENNGRSKLKKDQVIEIFKDNTTPKAHLAKKFGVDPAVIRCIQNKTKWTCVTKNL